MSEVLPDGWFFTNLGTISNIIGGGTPKSSEESNFCQPPNGIPWLTPADLSGYKEKYISNGRRNLTEHGYSSCSAKLVPQDTILFSSRAPIGYVAMAKRPITTNQGFRSIVPVVDISASFLYYFMKESKNKVERLASGSTFKEISGTKLKVRVPSVNLLEYPVFYFFFINKPIFRHPDLHNFQTLI